MYLDPSEKFRALLKKKKKVFRPNEITYEVLGRRFCGHAVKPMNIDIEHLSKLKGRSTRYLRVVHVGI